jgi:hypothetical protein
MRRNAKVVNDNTWNMKQAAVLMGQKEAARRAGELQEAIRQAELDFTQEHLEKGMNKPAAQLLRTGKNVNPTG